MKLSRSLLISVGITILAAALVSYLTGGHALAFILLLPLGYLFRRKRPTEERSNPADNRPIEPS